MASSKDLGGSNGFKGSKGFTGSKGRRGSNGFSGSNLLIGSKGLYMLPLAGVIDMIGTGVVSFFSVGRTAGVPL